MIGQKPPPAVLEIRGSPEKIRMREIHEFKVARSLIQHD